ncbi:MAG: hypothetical protein JWL93_1550 [Hyphomicrobiales bacterium]|nr:hypothetical protein [Hyphomicrobiales bacterium]
MWKFILLAMFYGQDGEILHEFRAPVVLNTEAACREMVSKNTFQKTEVEKNGRKYLVEAKADCIYDPPAQDQTTQSIRPSKVPPGDTDQQTARTTDAAAPKDIAGPDAVPVERKAGVAKSSRATPGPPPNAPPRARDARAPVRPAVRRNDVMATKERATSTLSARAGGFFDVWPGDVAGPEYDIPGLGRRR